MASEHPNEFLTAVSTTVVALFTVILAWSTIKLWRAGERHSERELRAYVSVIGIRRRPVLPTAPRYFEAIIEIRNTGQTPAYDFSLRTNIDLREFPLERPLILEPWKYPSKTVLGPNAPAGTGIPLGGSGELADSEMASLAAEKAAIYVFGEITYRDAFKKERFTRFRFRCNGFGFRDGFFMPCEEGNEAN